MSDEFSTPPLSNDRPRAGRRSNLAPNILAAIALAIGLFALLRIGLLRDRIATLEEVSRRVEQGQVELRSGIANLTERETAADRQLRSDIEGLRDLSRDVAALSAATAELQDRTASPQRSWARAEALALLELGQRMLVFEHDADAALGALELADARLAQLREPGLPRIRAELGREIQAVRALPRPDRAGITARLLAAERSASQLPVRGAAIAPTVAPEDAATATSASERAWAAARTALGRLVTVRHLDADREAGLIDEEQSLRRQHLELLVLSARIATLRHDQPVYQHSLREAVRYVDTYFATSDIQVQTLRAELDQLATTEIAPALPDISNSARLLQQTVLPTRPTGVPGAAP